ncbi:PqqD family protein [Shivajiella indica]|uniref:PqqD family protein n=1 Tax=Shivajiella indica TaxID=872115 RepID=A0ABW5B399_9BACT
MENSFYNINEDKVLFTELGEEGVIFDLESSDYLNLNETYCTVFKLLQESKGIHEIIQILTETYEVDIDVCQKDVEDVIKELLDKKFIFKIDHS